ncbi:MAG TPA: hypothetical protein VIC84_18265 [Blastocatellia bacterium]|jgi:hypothetical protein
MPERFHQVASEVEWGNVEIAIYAEERRRRDTFSMIGNDSPVNGLSSTSSGDEIVNCPLRAVDRHFPTIRYFSDACREAIGYSSPVTIGYELMHSILYLPQTGRTGAIIDAGISIPTAETAPAFRAIQCALDRCFLFVL